MPSSRKGMHGTCCRLIRSRNRDRRANCPRSPTPAAASLAAAVAAVVFNPPLLLVLLPLLVVFLAPSLGSCFVVPSTTSPLPLLSPRWRGSKHYHDGGQGGRTGSSTAANSVSVHGLGRQSNDFRRKRDQHQYQHQHQHHPLMVTQAAATTTAAGSWAKGFRASETRRHALQDETLDGLAEAVIPGSEVKLGPTSNRVTCTRGDLPRGRYELYIPIQRQCSSMVCVCVCVCVCVWCAKGRYLYT